MGLLSWQMLLFGARGLLLGVFMLWHAVAMQAAHGALIVAYDSSSNPDLLDVSEIGFGVHAIGLARGSGIARDTGTTSTFNSKGFTEDNLMTAQSANDYLQWGWSASTTTTNLTELDIRYDRSGTGPTQLAILLAVNAGDFQTIFTDSDVKASGENSLGIDLTSFTNVNSATFRLFAFGATSNSGTFDIENFQSSPGRGIAVHGVATPEPGTLTLLCVIGVVFFVRYWHTVVRYARQAVAWRGGRVGWPNQANNQSVLLKGK